MSTMRVTTLKNEASTVDQIVLNADGTFGGELNDALSSKLDSTAYQPGLVLIDSESFSAVSSLSVDGCFTSAYDFYRILVRATSSTSAFTTLRLRASGSDASGANTYKTQMIEGYSSSSAFQARSEAQQLCGWIDSTKACTIQAEFFGPHIAAATGIQIIGGRFDDAALFVGEHTAASAYDGFTIAPNSGTFTGTLRIYGYRN